MSRLTTTLLWCGIAVAIWLSERWSWMLPAIIGVGMGVCIVNAQRRPRDRRAAGAPDVQLGPLLILASFVYLYVVYLAFLCFEFDEAQHPVVGLMAGALPLSLLLAGLIAVTVFRRAPPQWLSALWDRLLEERGRS